MVRMIDADALFINLDGMMAVSPTGYIHGDTVADMISDAPTVDAIPVSWILENKNLARQVGAWQYELFLETLLKDWEEENEFDSRN